MHAIHPRGVRGGNMYFVRRKFKNIFNKITRKQLKREIPEIEADDCIYLFNDGMFVHERTSKEIEIGFQANTKEEMQEAIEMHFKKGRVVYKASTQLQYEKNTIVSEMPALVLNNIALFSTLITMGGYGKYHITSPIIAKLLNVPKYEAQGFIATGIKQGLFKKYGTSWAIDDTMWIKLKTLCRTQDFSIPALDSQGHEITRSGHTDSDVAKDIKKVVRKIVSDSENVEDSIINSRQQQSTVNHVSKKKKKLSNTHGELLNPEEAGASFK